MDRPDTSPRSRLGAALRAASETAAPDRPDFAAVYAAAARKPASTPRSLRAAGEPVARRYLLSFSFGAAAVAALLALAIGLGAGPGPWGGRSQLVARPESWADLDYLAEADPSADAALWLGREGAFDRATAYRVEGEADRIEAILIERPLEEDMDSFVAEVWRTTEL